MSLASAFTKILLWCSMLWLLLLLPTLYLWPLESTDKPIHLRKPPYLESDPQSLFISNVQEAVYEFSRKCPLPPRKRMILLGGSGSMGFEPVLLRTFANTDEVLNASVVLSNFTQMRQVFADMTGCLGEEGMHNTTFVLILSFGNFTANGIRGEGPYSYYEKEKLRSYLFAGLPGNVTPVISRSWLRLLIELWRPVILVHKITHEIKQEVGFLKTWIRQHVLGQKILYADMSDVTARDMSLSFIRQFQPDAETSEPYAPEQTAELERLITDIRAAGSGVLMVEQPAQLWLRTHSKAFDAGQLALQRVASRMLVPLVDLSRTGADDEFHDPMHANVLGARLWTERLLGALTDLQKSSPGALGPIAIQHLVE